MAWIYIYIWLFKMVTCGCIRWHTHTHIYIYIYIYIYMRIYIYIYVYIYIYIYISHMNTLYQSILPWWTKATPIRNGPSPSLWRHLGRGLRFVGGDEVCARWPETSKCGTKDRRKLRKWLLNVLNRAGFVWLRFMMFYMYSYVNLSGNYQQISSCFHPFMSIYHHVILYDIMCCHLL